MTPSEAAAQLALLRAAYPDARTKVGPDTADLWLRTLRHLDSDVGAKAVQSLIAAVKFWPSIAELNEHVALVREQTRRERQAAKRDEEDLALDEMPRLELRDIPAVVEFRKQYLSPLPLDLTPDGTCDDECGRTGLRYQLGRVQVCADCARRRLRAADRIASAACVSIATTPTTRRQGGARHDEAHAARPRRSAASGGDGDTQADRARPATTQHVPRSQVDPDPRPTDSARRRGRHRRRTGAACRVTDRSHLADDLARVLANEPLGLSGNDLVQRVRRRRSDVLATLRAEPLFVCVGRTKARRWRLVAGEPPGNGLEPLAALGAMLDRLDVIEARVDALERRKGSGVLP